MVHAAALAQDEFHPIRAGTMRFLADAGVSPRTVGFLSELGHNAVHVLALGLLRSPGIELVGRARADSRVVLTFDLDFGEILALGVLDKPTSSCFGSPTNAPNPSGAISRPCCLSAAPNSSLVR